MVGTTANTKGSLLSYLVGGPNIGGRRWEREGATEHLLLYDFFQTSFCKKKKDLADNNAGLEGGSEKEFKQKKKRDDLGTIPQGGGVRRGVS